MPFGQHTVLATESTARGRGQVVIDYEHPQERAGEVEFLHQTIGKRHAKHAGAAFGVGAVDIHGGDAIAATAGVGVDAGVDAQFPRCGASLT
jgi:hypothetical protein